MFHLLLHRSARPVGTIDQSPASDLFLFSSSGHTSSIDLCWHWRGSLSHPAPHVPSAPARLSDIASIPAQINLSTPPDAAIETNLPSESPDVAFQGSRRNVVSGPNETCAGLGGL